MKHPQLLAAVMILVLVSIVNAEKTPDSISDILRTDQYILSAQDDRYIYLERNVSHGQCPQVTSQPRYNSKILDYTIIGIHLVRDTSGVFPPKIMAITEHQRYYSVDLLPLNVVYTHSKEFEQSLDKIDTKTVSHIYMDPGKTQQVSQSVFDTTNHILYLLHSSPGSSEFTAYALRNELSDEKPLVRMLDTFNQKKSVLRYGWFEDPYSSKVYYKEDIGNETLLFEGPMREFAHLFSGKIPGKRIKNLTPEDKFQGASNGVFFGVNKDSENNRTLFIVSPESGLSANCSIISKTTDSSSKNSLLIVRNNDYCMIRDGSIYNRSQCEEEQEEFMKRYLVKIEEEEEAFDSVKWLMVFCILLGSVVVLQCVYIYWLRSSFVSADEQMIQNENETEASMFIAKQRSFPTSYQDPALLDISVDKWN